jgi:maleylacetoacetate isomerase
MKLYDYFRSSAAYRVRIALNLKGLLPSASSSTCARRAARRRLSRGESAGLVPALVTDDGTVLTQSLAIVEYLDETVPSPPLLPRDPLERARVRSLAQAIACDIHPDRQPARAALSAATRSAWKKRRRTPGTSIGSTWASRRWRSRCRAMRGTGRFCHGDSPTLADICLVPQLANARRVDMDLSPYPTLTRIDAECNKVKAFADAAPPHQPDFEP